MSALRRRWASLPAAEKGRWSGVTLCVVLYLVHYVLLSTWYIEDAAITFTFSRHLATGEGLVAWPGGERVEGYSNPSWTFLLAMFDLVGMSPWISAKLCGGIFGALTIPLAYLWVRDLDARDDDPGLLPLLAPFALAVGPQFVLWNASGLENSLVNLCLAAACVGMFRELRVGGVPWSGLPLGLLAVSRPDAPLYCAVAAGLAVLFAIRARGVAALPWAAGLAGVSLAPLAAYKAFALWYFAWPLPNTFYAKLHEMDKFKPFSWDSHAWRYLRNWALESAWGFLMPFSGPLLTGIGGRPGWIGLGAAAVLLATTLPGLGWPHAVISWEEPEFLVTARVVVFALLALGLPLVGLGRRGDVARITAWYLFVAVAFFALYAGGDWMKSYRWLATAQVPLAVLLTDFLSQLLPRVTRHRDLVGLGIAGPVLITGVVGTGRFLADVETSPYDVYKRVRYMRSVQERLHLDHVVLMDVDFGAQMWWTGQELLDMAGLVDVPMAQHAWEFSFVREYVFEERRPDFAHVHGGWDKRTGMSRQPVFRLDYLEIPGYPTNRTYQHIGNHIRKDLFVAPHGVRGTERAVAFDRGPRLTGLHLPAPQVAAGQTLYVEVDWAMQKSRLNDFRALLFLSDGDRLLVWDLPPGYDWYPPKTWRRDEVIVGRHALPLPNDLRPGRYDLGLVVLGHQGEVLPAAAPATPPRYATGEVRWDGSVEVVPLEDAEARVAEGTGAALAAADQTRCADAEDVLARARRHLSSDHPAQPRARREVIEAMARCWARQAAAAADPASGEDAIRRARRWDHRDPAVVDIARQLADRWEAQGDAILAGPDPDEDAAYGAWRRALTAEPTRAWLRRRAESLRDRRLDTTGAPTRDELPGGVP